MRRALDASYAAAAWVAAGCMIGVLGMVVLGIAGREFGFFVPGTDAYAGYLMAAAGFLALAHALKRGDHIRVTLIVNRLVGETRRGFELASLGIGVVLALLFAWFSARLVLQSIEFDDISTGNDATPLWIPQLAMAAGSALFAIALVDEWWLEFTRRRARPVPGAAAHNE
ncbi:MAG: TRAP transporter small permease [Lautropia sp.]